MFVFWSKHLVVLLAGTLALALPATQVNAGDVATTNRKHFVPQPGETVTVSISPNVLWFWLERRIGPSGRSRGTQFRSR